MKHLTENAKCKYQVFSNTDIILRAKLAFAYPFQCSSVIYLCPWWSAREDDTVFNDARKSFHFLVGQDSWIWLLVVCESHALVKLGIRRFHFNVPVRNDLWNCFNLFFPLNSSFFFIRQMYIFFTYLFIEKSNCFETW